MMRRGLILIASGAVMLALLAADARADTTTIRPGGSWNVGAVHIKSLHAGGVKLTRVCNATGSTCRYYKLRPRSACRVVCPIVAAWQTWRGGQNGRIIVPRSSRWSVRVTFERLPQCECSA